MILDAERGLFTPPLFQEQDFGVFVSVGDLYTTLKLTPGEELCVNLVKGRVLELGAGFGRLSQALRARGLEVVTTDADADLVAMYQARGWADSFPVVLPDIPGSLGKFDVVIALRGVLGLSGELDRVRRSLHRIRQLLNPGGRLIFTSSRPTSLLVVPGRSPLEYRIRFIYRGCRSPWLQCTSLPEWLAIPFLRELGFINIQTLDPGPSEGAGYYVFAKMN
jgi:SAM-dependent methyltransferase